MQSIIAAYDMSEYRQPVVNRISRQRHWLAQKISVSPKTRYTRAYRRTQTAIGTETSHSVAQNRASDVAQKKPADPEGPAGCE